MLRKLVAASMLVVALGAPLAACSSSGSKGPISKAGLQKAYEKNPNGLTTKEIRCVVDALYPELSDTEKRALGDPKKAKLDDAAKAALNRKLGDAVTKCAPRLAPRG